MGASGAIFGILGALATYTLRAGNARGRALGMALWRDIGMMLLLGFIVGVPREGPCEGSGDRLASCLEHTDMIERVDPVSMTRLVPSCASTDGEAYPPRRFLRTKKTFSFRSLKRR